MPQGFENTLNFERLKYCGIQTEKQLPIEKTPAGGSNFNSSPESFT